MKSAIFLTWFFTIVFFSQGVNTPNAGASCNVATPVKQAVANRLKAVELTPEPAQAAEIVPAVYEAAAATAVEPAGGDTPRFNPLAHSAQRYGADAESYYMDKQDQLQQALMSR